MFNRTVQAALAAALAVALPLGAQTPVRALTRPDAEFPESFSEIFAVRELRDGRVLVSDHRELTLQVVDFRTGTATMVGRTGAGPGEYRLPERLLLLPGDSTLLVDGASGRLLIITPNAKTSGLLDLNSGAEPGVAGGWVRFRPRSSDARGRMYMQASPVRYFSDGRPPELADSAAIVRLDRATNHRDTVAYVPLAAEPTRKITRDGTVYSEQRLDAFRAADEWTVAPDGRVAVVHVKPYHVDFVNANGTRQPGPPIAYQPIKVTAAHKKQFLEEVNRPTMGVVIHRVGGSTVEPMRVPIQGTWKFPDVLPPFLVSQSNISFAGDGTLWVKRTTDAGAPPTYDLIDTTGRAVEQVRLPQNTRLLGFGNGTVYVARVDTDELEYLQRYRFTR